MTRALEKMALPPDTGLAKPLERLGTVRNKVKHRGQRDLAAGVVDEHIGTTAHFTSWATGCFLAPSSALLIAVHQNPDLLYRTSMVTPTRGKSVHFTRY